MLYGRSSKVCLLLQILLSALPHPLVAEITTEWYCWMNSLCDYIIEICFDLYHLSVLWSALLLWCRNFTWGNWCSIRRFLSHCILDLGALSCIFYFLFNSLNESCFSKICRTVVADYYQFLRVNLFLWINMYVDVSAIFAFLC